MLAVSSPSDSKEECILDSETCFKNDYFKLKPQMTDEFDNQTYTKIWVVWIPLTFQNLTSLVIIISLTLIGTIYVWVLGTWKSCRCALCKGEYNSLTKLAEGGFSSVFKVKDRSENVFVLKKTQMKDITDLDFV